MSYYQTTINRRNGALRNLCSNSGQTRTKKYAHLPNGDDAKLRCHECGLDVAWRIASEDWEKYGVYDEVLIQYMPHKRNERKRLELKIKETSGELRNYEWSIERLEGLLTSKDIQDLQYHIKGLNVTGQINSHIAGLKRAQEMINLDLKEAQAALDKLK